MSGIKVGDINVAPLHDSQQYNSPLPDGLAMMDIKRRELLRAYIETVPGRPSLAWEDFIRVECREMIRRAVRDAVEARVAAERERCARVAEGFQSANQGTAVGREMVDICKASIATKIREGK